MATPLATEIDLREINRLMGMRGIPSHRQLALRAGVDPSNFSRICRGHIDPTLGTVRKLSRALGAQLRDIIVDDDEPTRLGP